MTIVESIGTLRELLRRERLAGQTIGFVPTMGYLHAGHLSLVEHARAESTYIVASIFVNPTQFGPNEDLSTYPRDLEGDLRKLETAGCDLVFVPTVAEMYPVAYATSVVVGDVTSRYEGAFRPDHFRGVSTVVAKLFNIVLPDAVFFGQKDAQQVAVIRRMIEDLNYGIKLVVVETVREPDGLAMSSRNVYLSAEDREHALTISRALYAAREAVAAGAGPDEATDVMRRTLSPTIALDYADVIDPDSFQRAATGDGALLGIIAGRVGRTRLIDNMTLKSEA